MAVVTPGGDEFDYKQLADARRNVWQNRKRASPLRTFSGNIVYKRPKHQFTVGDAYRIIERLGIEFEEYSPEGDWLKKLFFKIGRWFFDHVTYPVFQRVGLGEIYKYLWNWVMEYAYTVLIENVEEFVEAPIELIKDLIEALAAYGGISLEIKED